MSDPRTTDFATVQPAGRAAGTFDAPAALTPGGRIVSTPPMNVNVPPI
jgi:hypothetical protein